MLRLLFASLRLCRSSSKSDWTAPCSTRWLKSPRLAPTPSYSGHKALAVSAQPPFIVKVVIVIEASTAQSIVVTPFPSQAWRAPTRLLTLHASFKSQIDFSRSKTDHNATLKASSGSWRSLAPPEIYLWITAARGPSLWFRPQQRDSAPSPQFSVFASWRIAFGPRSLACTDCSGGLAPRPVVWLTYHLHSRWRPQPSCSAQRDIGLLLVGVLHS